MKYYINGKYVKENDAKISIHDMGFEYGYGIFETMRFDKKKIFSYTNHIDRLYKGLKISKIKIDKNKNQILSILNKVININNLNSGMLKLIITKGNENNLKKNDSSIFVIIKPFYEVSEVPVKILYLDEKEFPLIRYNPAIKSMNYIGNIMAKEYCESMNVFESVFFNQNKIVTECAMRNIFFIKNKVLYTPSLDLGILAGIMRSLIINIASDLKLEVKECHIPLNEVKLMDEAFISSTGIGLVECYWDNWKSDYRYSKRIKKELFNRIKNN